MSMKYFYFDSAVKRNNQDNIEIFEKNLRTCDNLCRTHEINKKNLEKKTIPGYFILGRKKARVSKFENFEFRLENFFRVVLP